MRRTIVGTLALVVALALAAGALAVDVQLKDGTVIHAASYKVKGSYVLVRLENGSQVAYDLGDVKLEAMKAAEKAAQPAPKATKPTAPANAFAGAMATGRGKAALKITDQDVSHVETGSPVSRQTKEKKPLADHQEGGQVVVQGVRVDPSGKAGTWLATGEVVNRMGKPVTDVRVLVQAIGPSSKVIGEAELPVAGTLDPGQSGKFSHLFKAAKQPLLRVRVFWMQRVEPSATPGAGNQGGSPSTGGSPQMGAQGGGASSTTAAAKKNQPPSPPSLQWGGAPAYKRAGTAPPPTPLPY